MKKRKSPDREYHDGENNTGHYNFVLLDREILFSTSDEGENVRSSLNLSLPAIGLYAVIKAHAINKNFCYPALTTLQRITGATKETLIKYTKELVDAGLLIIEKDTTNPGRPQNVYIIPRVNKEGVKAATIAPKDGDPDKGRQIEPLTESGTQRSEKPTFKVGNDDLQRSEKPTLKRLSNYTNQVRLDSPAGEIIYSDGSWTYYADETARYEDEPTVYRWDSMPRSIPWEVQQWRDEKYKQGRRRP